MVENAGSVLGTGVWSLAIRGCGVVHAVEEFKELAVGDLGWVVGYLEGFCIYSPFVLVPNSYRETIEGRTYDQFFLSIHFGSLDSLCLHQYIQLAHHIIPFP